MRRIIIAAASVATFIAATAATRPALAGDTIYISAERMFGVGTTTGTTKSNGSESSATITGFSLLGATSPLANPFDQPRIAVDVNALGGLTFGAAGAVGLSSYRYESGGKKSDGPSITGILIAPRVGYMVNVADTLILWPRAGVSYTSYQSADSSGDSKNTTSVVAATIDPTLIFKPFSHFGFSASALADIGLSGTRTSKSTSTIGTTSTTSTQEIDYKVTTFGLRSGIVGSF